MECIDADQGGCRGTVEMRFTNPSTMRSRPLCEVHQKPYLDAWERSLELTSPMPASWFDESYAGERWDDDY